MLIGSKRENPLSKMPLPVVSLDPHLIHGSLGPR